VFFRMSKKPVDKLIDVQRASILVLAALKTLRVFDILQLQVPKPDEVKMALISHIA
jgi:hypothetical protein